MAGRIGVCFSFFTVLLLRGREELERPDEQVVAGKKVVFRQDNKADEVNVGLDIEREREKVVLPRSPEQQRMICANICKSKEIYHLKFKT